MSIVDQKLNANKENDVKQVSCKHTMIPLVNSEIFIFNFF